MLKTWTESSWYTLLLATREELAELSYIEEGNFKEGILFQFSDSTYSKGKLTVKADKYRTPLGAVGAEFTVNFKDGVWTVEEPGMVWIS